MSERVKHLCVVGFIALCSMLGSALGRELPAIKIGDSEESVRKYLASRGEVEQRGAKLLFFSKGGRLYDAQVGFFDKRCEFINVNIPGKLDVKNVERLLQRLAPSIEFAREAEGRAVTLFGAAWRDRQKEWLAYFNDRLSGNGGAIAEMLRSNGPFGLSIYSERWWESVR